MSSVFWFALQLLSQTQFRVTSYPGKRRPCKIRLYLRDMHMFPRKWHMFIFHVVAYGMWLKIQLSLCMYVHVHSVMLMYIRNMKSETFKEGSCARGWTMCLIIIHVNYLFARLFLFRLGEVQNLVLFMLFAQEVCKTNIFVFRLDTTAFTASFFHILGHFYIHFFLLHAYLKYINY